MQTPLGHSGRTFTVNFPLMRLFRLLRTTGVRNMLTNLISSDHSNKITKEAAVSGRS